MVCRYDEPVDRYFVSDHCYEVAFMLRRPWHHPDYPIYSLALPPEEAIARLHRACREDILLMPTLWGCRALEKYVLPSAFDGFFSDALARAIWAGDVAIIRLEREWRGRLPPLPGELPGPGAGTGPGPQPKTDTWFDLTVIDEMGVPIPGVELLFSFDQQVHVTDRDGRIELRGLPPQFHQTRVRTPPPAATPPSGEPQPLDSLRAAVKPRWDQIRPGPRYEPGPDDLVVPLHRETPIDTSLLSERPRTIVVVPWVLRARLDGFYFNYGRCFPRPEGLEDIGAVLGTWRSEPRSAAIVVGHTSIGDDVARGERVSMQRAEALVAYLHQDVEAWLKHYQADADPDERWGPREDQLMLCALPDADALIASGDTIVAFQRSRGLEPTGAMSGRSRTALIGEYMRQGPTLPTNIVRLEACACGLHTQVPLDEPRTASDDVGATPSALVATAGVESQGAPMGGVGSAPPAADAAPSASETVVCEAVGATGDAAPESAWPAPEEPAALAHDAREVELFLFDAALGPQPLPAGSIAENGIATRPEWERRVVDRRDHQRLGEELPCHLTFELRDEASRPVPALDYELDIGDNVHLRGTTDNGGCLTHGAVRAGDCELAVAGVRMVVPALNHAEGRRTLWLRDELIRAAWR